MKRIKEWREHEEEKKLKCQELTSTRYHLRTKSQGKLNVAKPRNTHFVSFDKNFVHRKVWKPVSNLCTPDYTDMNTSPRRADSPEKRNGQGVFAFHNLKSHPKDFRISPGISPHTSVFVKENSSNQTTTNQTRPNTFTAIKIK